MTLAPTCIDQRRTSRLLSSQSSDAPFLAPENATGRGSLKRRKEGKEGSMDCLCRDAKGGGKRCFQPWVRVVLSRAPKLFARDLVVLGRFLVLSDAFTMGSRVLGFTSV